MKKIIRFSRFFLPAAILSTVLVIAAVAGYIFMGGFVLGVDFQAGAMQEVQFAPTAFSITYSGRGDAQLGFNRSGLNIVISGAGVESGTFVFPFSEYPNIGALGEAMMSRVEGLEAQFTAAADVNSQWLVQSAQEDSQLRSAPYVIHYLDPQSPVIDIATVREAMTSLGQTVAVQSLGRPQDRHFMIRLEDEEGEGGASALNVIGVLEGYFGEGEIVVLRSDYVEARFSKNLSDQAGLLLGLTLLLILAYASIRFKPQYAVGAVIGIMHDAIIMVGFVVWSRMEFNTTTIAAILTILGYSINNTIVIFDRIRENRRIYPDEAFVDVLNRSITDTFSRTVITTLTTMLAVISLFIFTTGSMKDFALALIVGMLSGVYTTIFIACGFVNFWEIQKSKREKRKLASVISKA